MKGFSRPEFMLARLQLSGILKTLGRSGEAALEEREILRRYPRWNPGEWEVAEVPFGYGLRSMPADDSFRFK